MLNSYLTVIIPTYKDWDKLQLCLDALEEQSLLKDYFEIIVVNNEPNDLLPIDFRVPINCSLLTESNPGSYAARNTAIKHAKGDVFAFTDSDCIPHKDWLKNAMELISQGKYRIAGNVELFYSSDFKTVVELYEQVYAFDQIRHAATGTSITANLIARREVFEKIGLFDDQLLSGGDIDWGWRANHHQFEIVYASNVKVYHPARKKIADILKKIRRISGGSVHIEGSFKTFLLLRLFLLGFLPPLSLKKTITNNDLTLSQKIKVLCLAYYLRVYGSILKIGYLLKLLTPTRS
jgi:glycosyltransferase involved in cell wall biosynthesis